MQKDEINKDKVLRAIEEYEIRKNLPRVITERIDFKTTLNRYLNAGDDAASCEFGEYWISFHFYTSSCKNGSERFGEYSYTFKPALDNRGIVVVFQHVTKITSLSEETWRVNTKAFYSPLDGRDETFAIGLRVTDANVLGICEVRGGEVSREKGKTELNKLGDVVYKNLLVDCIKKYADDEVMYHGIRRMIKNYRGVYESRAMQLLLECENALVKLRDVQQFILESK